MVEVKKKAIKKWLRSKLQSEVRQVALWSHCLRCCWCLLGAVSSYYKCTLQWTKQPTNNTAFCLVQHWCDHISDCCDSIEWLWSHNPDPLHTLCTWSPIDGDQLRSPSCSCWHLELQIQTRKHERRNVRAHCTICNVHLCLGTRSSLQCNVWVGLPATQVVYRPRVDKQIRPQSLESQFTENSSALPYSPTQGWVPCLLGEISRLQQFHFTNTASTMNIEHWMHH